MSWTVDINTPTWNDAIGADRSGVGIDAGEVHAVEEKPLFCQALPLASRGLVVVLSILWLSSVGVFWYWWLEPGHRVTVVATVVVCILQFYVTTLPAPFLLAALRVRRVNPELDVRQFRVAFVVTKAPSEPWRLVQTTLRAMLVQDYPFPYDVWLCDEHVSEETEEWCRAVGVNVSCRWGIEEYHRPNWPRRTKCKEGNLAYFYDHWGYRDYDVVSQLDADHVPAPGYLTEIVRPFSAASIGYVSAPSICDTNAAESWAARGRLYVESGFHGPFQAGLNQGLAPVCIGSHYAVRTKALKEIGGLGPELAEDFTTTFMMSSAGWRGAFALDAEAHGLGPQTIGAMLTQEFQWSRSLVTVFLDLFPKKVRRLPWHLRLRYGYALACYPTLATVMVAASCLAPIACLAGIQWYRVDYYHYLIAVAVLASWPTLVFVLLRANGLLRPKNAPLVSWERALFLVTRWPFVLRGVIAALWLKVSHQETELKVTPKEQGTITRLSMAIVAPYLFLSVMMAGAAIGGLEHVFGQHVFTRGYAALALLGASVYAIVSVAVPALHARDGRRSTGASWRQTVSAVWLPLLLALEVTGCVVYAWVFTLPALHLSQI